MRKTSHHLDINIKQLPPALAATLRQATRRIRRILFVRGMLAVVATALIALLLIMAVDAAVVIYSPAVRWGLSLVGLAAVAWVAARMLIGPLTQRFSLPRIAALIEQRHPELEERLSTVVELLAMPETFGRGSEQLVALITEAAEADARTVVPKQEFTGRTVKPKLIAAAAAIGVLGVLFAMFPQYAGVLALRALAPFAEIDNVFAQNLTVQPGHAVVLIGDSFEVEVAVVNAFSGQAYLRRQNVEQGGREMSERMRQVQSEDPGLRQYRQLFPVVEQSFRYRVSCGHALTRRYTVTAVMQPDVEITSVRYVYPEYTRLPPLTQTNIVGGIAALAGTRVEIAAQLNRPDIGGTFTLPPHETWSFASNKAQRAACDFVLPKNMNAHLAIQLRDGYGFTNNPVTYPVRALPDRPPTITFTRPNKPSVRLARDARLMFKYSMTDDFGVTNAVLFVSRNDEPFAPHTVIENYAEVDEETWEGAELFNLAALDLANVSKLRLQLCVEDNLPKDLGGPQVARSAILTIELDDGARALEVQQYQDAAQKLEAALRAVMEEMRQTERNVEELRSMLDRKEQLNASAQQKLDNIRQEITAEEQKLKDLAEQNRDSAHQAMAEKLDQLREDHLEAARQTAEDAQQAAQEEQPQIVRDLEKRMQDAVKAAEEMIKDAQEFAKQLDKLAQLDELATREQALADNAQDKTTPQEMNDWRNRQEDLRNQFNQQVAERPEAKLEAMQARKERLDQLTEEVKAMAAEQQQLREQAAQQQDVTEQQQDLTQRIETARQQADDIRQDMQRFQDVAQPVQNPLNQANNHLQQAQQRSNEAAQNMERNQAAQRQQQDTQNQLDNARRDLENAQREMDRAIEKQQERMDRRNPLRDADLERLQENRETLRTLSEQAQQLAAEQAQLTQAQRNEVAEKQQAEREQRPFTPSQENAQRAQQEQQIAQQAQEVSRQTEALRNEMQQMGAMMNPLRQPLEEARREMDAGQQRARDAAQTLNNQPRQPHESLWRQEDAQRGLEKAAAALMQTERRLDQLMEQAEQQQAAREQAARDIPPMDAADHMREAMREAAQQQMQNAEQEAQAAADQMRQLVQQEAMRMSVPTEFLPSQMPSQSPTPPRPPRPEPPPPMPPFLRDNKLPDTEWFRLRGEINAQAMDEALRKVSPEYRELVRMYFRELSKQNQ